MYVTFFDKIVLVNWMKFLWDKRNYFLGIVIVLLLFGLFLFKNNEQEETFDFNGKKVTYVFYQVINKKDVYKKIKDIYKKYDDYSSKLNEKLDDGKISFLEYGRILYAKTNGVIDITNGEYDLKLKNYEVVNNSLKDKINFNIDGILASYATSEVLDYFDLKGINKYIINVDGDIITGHKKNGYNVSLHDVSGSLLNIISLDDKSLSVVNERRSTFGEGLYDSVWVISDDILTSNMLANYLYFLSVDEGKKVASRFSSEVLWLKDGELYMTEKFSNYFVKNL